MYEFSDDFIKRFSLLTLTHCDKDVITRISQESDLFGEISHYFDFFCDYVENSEKLIEGIKLLHIKFEEISVRKSVNEFVELVYSNNLYEFNQENIIKMYDMFYMESHTSLRIPTYTRVSETDRLNQRFLKEYIDENINDYIVMLLSSYGHVIRDNVLSLVRLLNEPNIRISEKKEYVAKLQLEGMVNDIRSINDSEIWPDLIHKNYVVYNDNNIFAYYCVNHRLDNTLIEFINKKEKIGINLEAITSDGYQQSYIKDYADDILKCNTIKDSVFNSLLSSNKVYYESFTYTGISDERITILITLHRIAMNLSNLLFFRENYPDHVILFVKNDIEAYINIALSQSAGFNYDEIIKLLQSNIEHRFKTSLINLCNQCISVVRHEFETDVEKEIVSSNCFDPSDFVSLFHAYPNLDIDYQTRIYVAVKTHFTYVCQHKLQLPEELYQNLLNTRDVNPVDLVISQLKYWDELKIVQALYAIDKKEFTAIFDPKRRPGFEVDEENKKLLDAFVQEGYIEDYKIGKNNKYLFVRNKK